MAEESQARPAQPAATTSLTVGGEYANSTRILFSATEVQIIFALNGSPRRVMILPFGVAKHMANELQRLLTRYETDLGVEIQIPSVLDAKMREILAKEKEKAKEKEPK